MITISEVIGLTDQGKSHVYLCRGTDDRLYYVKGLCCGRDSQVAEWVCAHLARELQLPFPEFHLVDIPEELYEMLPAQQKEIGCGIAFATVEVRSPRWLDNPTTHQVDPSLAAKVLLFDYWIQNMDRSTVNTNVLIKAEDQSIVLIDHNLAFDSEFDAGVFFSLHIFHSHRSYWTQDLVNRTELSALLDRAQSKLDDILEGVPEAWNWKNIERDLPANLDTGRHSSPEFWRHE
ncbi:HipA family kinase [Salinispirillum marinum]|uniref:HipA family kinase n=2 Tax=Saccharospirillaceae TaxID=255527 RepID=A0ABV8BEG1_9GAMM